MVSFSPSSTCVVLVAAKGCGMSATGSAAGDDIACVPARAPRATARREARRHTRATSRRLWLAACPETLGSAAGLPPAPAPAPAPPRWSASTQPPPPPPPPAPPQPLVQPIDWSPRGNKSPAEADSLRDSQPAPPRSSVADPPTAAATAATCRHRRRRCCHQLKPPATRRRATRATSVAAATTAPSSSSPFGKWISVLTSSSVPTAAAAAIRATSAAAATVPAADLRTLVPQVLQGCAAPQPQRTFAFMSSQAAAAADATGRPSASPPR